MKTIVQAHRHVSACRQQNANGGIELNQTEERCLNCERTSEQVPLLAVRYQGNEFWICPQCLPVLIHKPERLSAVAGEWTKNRVEEEH